MRRTFGLCAERLIAPMGGCANGPVRDAHRDGARLRGTGYGVVRSVRRAPPCPVTVHLVDSDGVTCQYANRAARQRLPAFIMTGSAATADEHRAIPVDRGDDGALAPLRAAAAAVADGPALDWPDLLDR